MYTQSFCSKEALKYFIHTHIIFIIFSNRNLIAIRVESPGRTFRIVTFWQSIWERKSSSRFGTYSGFMISLKKPSYKSLRPFTPVIPRIQFLLIYLYELYSLFIQQLYSDFSLFLRLQWFSAFLYLLCSCLPVQLRYPWSAESFHQRSGWNRRADLSGLWLFENFQPFIVQRQAYT